MPEPNEKLKRELVDFFEDADPTLEPTDKYLNDVIKKHKDPYILFNNLYNDYFQDFSEGAKKASIKMHIRALGDEAEFNKVVNPDGSLNVKPSDIYTNTRQEIEKEKEAKEPQPLTPEQIAERESERHRQNLEFKDKLANNEVDPTTVNFYFSFRSLMSEELDGERSDLIKKNTENFVNDRDQFVEQRQTELGDQATQMLEDYRVKTQEEYVQMIAKGDITEDDAAKAMEEDVVKYGNNLMEQMTGQLNRELEKRRVAAEADINKQIKALNDGYFKPRILSEEEIKASKDKLFEIKVPVKPKPTKPEPIAISEFMEVGFMPKEKEKPIPDFTNATYEEKRRMLDNEWKALKRKKYDEWKDDPKQQHKLKMLDDAKEEFYYHMLDDIVYGQKGDLSVYAIKSLAQNSLVEVAKEIRNLEKEKMDWQEENRQIKALFEKKGLISERSPGPFLKQDQLNTANAASEKLRRVLEHPEEDSGYFANFAKGMDKGLGITKSIPVLATFYDLLYGVSLYDVIEKAKRGETLNKSEQALYDAQGYLNAINIESPMPAGYGAGYSLTSEMIPWLGEFAIEIALTKGGVSASKAVAKKAVKDLSEGRLKRILGKEVLGTKYTIGDAAIDASITLVRPAAMTAVNPMRYISDTYERMTDQTIMMMTPEGDGLINQINQQGEDFNEAAMKAFGMGYVERFTEMLGPYIGKSPAFIKRLLKDTKALNYLQKTAIARWMSKNGIDNTADAMRKIASERIGWHGFFNEMIEEELALGLQNMINGELPYKTTWAEQRDIGVSVGIMSAAFGGIAKTAQLIKPEQSLRYETTTPEGETVERTLKFPKGVLDKAEELRLAEDFTIEDFTPIAMMAGKLTEEQKTALAGYIFGERHELRNKILGDIDVVAKKEEAKAKAKEEEVVMAAKKPSYQIAGEEFTEEKFSKALERPELRELIAKGKINIKAENAPEEIYEKIRAIKPEAAPEVKPEEAPPVKEEVVPEVKPEVPEEKPPAPKEEVPVPEAEAPPVKEVPKGETPAINKLIEDIDRYNRLTPAKKKKEALLLNDIKLRAREAGYEVEQRVVGAPITVTKEGKKIRREPVVGETPTSAVEGFVGLEQRTEKPKAFIKKVIELAKTNPSQLLGIGLGISKKEVAGIINDIETGKNTRRSHELMEKLQEAEERGYITVSEGSGFYTEYRDIPAKGFIGEITREIEEGEKLPDEEVSDEAIAEQTELEIAIEHFTHPETREVNYKKIDDQLQKDEEFFTIFPFSLNEGELNELKTKTNEQIKKIREGVEVPKRPIERSERKGEPEEVTIPEKLKGLDLASEGLDDIVRALGAKMEIIGENRPDVVKALIKIATGLAQHTGKKGAELIAEIKAYLKKKGIVGITDKDIDDLSGDILKRVEAEAIEIPEKERVKKTEIQKEVEEVSGQRVKLSSEFKNLRKKLKTREAKTEDIVKFIKAAKPELLGKADINRIVERVRDVVSKKKALDIAVMEIETVFKKRVKNNMLAEIDKHLKSKTITEEGKIDLNKIKDAIALNKENSIIERNKLQAEIEGFKDLLHDVVDETEISEIEEKIEDREFQLKILDEFSDIDSKSLEDIEVLSDINREGIKKYKDDFKELRETERERLNAMNVEAAETIYGTEERKEKLAGRKDVPRDTEKERKKTKSVLRAFSAAFETLPNLFHILNQSFRAGMDIIHEQTIFGRFMANIRKGASKAMDIKQTMYTELRAKIKELFGNEIKLRKILDKKHTVLITPPGKAPEIRKIKLGTLAHIWASWNSPANRKTVEKIGITEEVVRQIEEIHELEKVNSFSEWLMDDFLPESYDESNSIFEKKTGKKLPRLERYLPINAKSWKVKGETIDIAVVDVFKSFTKERVGGKYDLTKNDILDTATKYINDYSNFIGLAETISDIQSVFKSRIVQNAIERTGTSPFVESIFEALNNGYNGRTMPQTMAGRFLDNKALNFVRRRFIQTKILANLSLFPKQITSSIAVFDGSYGNPIGIAREMVTLPFSDAKSIVIDIARHSPQFKGRNMVDIEALAEGREKIRTDMFGEEGIDMALGVALTFLWNPSQIGDKFTIAMAGIPMISYNYKLELKKLKQDDIIGDEAKAIASEKVLLLFEAFMDETQQTRQFTGISSFQRGGWRNATMFLNAPMSYTRKLFRNNREIARGYGDRKAKLKRENPDMTELELSIKSLSGIKGSNVLGASIYGTVLPVLWSTVVAGGANIAGLFSDDEEERKSAWVQLSFDATLGWTKGLFGIGFLIDYIQNKARDKYYGPSMDNIVKTFDDIFEFSDDVIKVGKYLSEISEGDLTNEDEKRLYNALFNVSNKSLSYILGLPEEEIKKIKQAFLDDDYETATEKILRIYGMRKDAIMFWSKVNQETRSSVLLD